LPAVASRNHGKLVQIGVRPEAIKLVAPGRGTLNATFEFVEELGSGRLYHLLFEDLTIAVMAADRPSLAMGTEVGLHFPAAAVHLFDADSGRRVDVAPLAVVEHALV
jgi:sn-glycerol 3-phosphate transport system ATP-binding protein